MARSKPQRAWTAGELATLARLYADTTNADLAGAMGRSVASITRKAFNLGLRKSDAARRAANSGQFKPGHRTWNKGLDYHAGGRSLTTQFGPGHIGGAAARRLKPIGHLQVNDEGYLEQKVTDAPGPRHARWRPVHRLVWERAHGAVPAGHAVVFKPGRRTAELDLITPDALELVTRAELMRRNTVHRYGPEVARIAQLRGAVNRQINKRARQGAERS